MLIIVSLLVGLYTLCLIRCRQSALLLARRAGERVDYVAKAEAGDTTTSVLLEVLALPGANGERRS